VAFIELPCGELTIPAASLLVSPANDDDWIDLLRAHSVQRAASHPYSRREHRILLKARGIGGHPGAAV
jgi:hypothetical protein